MEKYICPNCGAQVRSPYCPQCGQRRGPERLSWKALWEGSMSTFLGDGFDGETGSVVRYGVLGTLWQILRHPVITVTAFLAGKRRTYFNPIALFLLLSAFIALVNSMLGTKLIDTSAFPSIVGEETLNSYMEVVFAYINSHPATYALVQIPFVALTYKWIFRPRKLRYIEFLYVGIFTSFFSLIITFLSSLTHVDSSDILGALIAFLPLLCIETAIYRRIFGRSIVRTAGNLLLGYAIWLILLFIFMLLFMFIGGIAYAIATSA